MADPSTPVQTAPSELAEVSVRFVPRNPRSDVAVPDTALSVPAKLSRYGLSEIVNHLASIDPPRPFDFLIDGHFLRTSLAKFLQTHNKTAEDVLVLEYVEAMAAPPPAHTLPHPDWISSVDGRHSQYVATGCYDGSLRLFSSSQLLADDSKAAESEPLCTGAGHTHAVRSVRFFAAPAGASSVQFVSGGKDQSVRVWHWSGELGTPAANVGTAAAHLDSVESVATCPRASENLLFCSGGWDKRVLLFKQSLADLTEGAADGEPKKKRKGAAASESSRPAVDMTPSHVLEGHAQSVSSVCWPDPRALYSGSWDMSIKMWDAETGECTSTWNGNKQISSIDFSLSANLLASAHNDGAIRLWDPRSQRKEVVDLVLRSHKGWSTSVAFCPLASAGTLLASASHDHTVKVWDVRASIPLHTLSVHSDKVLAVSWHTLLAAAGGEPLSVLLSGGADNKLRTHKLQLSQ